MSKQQNPIRNDRIDNPNGTYTLKEVNDNPSEGVCLSRIAVYDYLDRPISCIFYIDKNFKNVSHKWTREYLDNAEYYETKIYEKSFYAEIFSSKCLYDKSGKFLKGSYYGDKKLKKILYTVQCEYFDDGSYCESFIYEKPDDNGIILFKHLYNETEICLKRWTYKDKAQKKLFSTDYFEYLHNKKYIRKSIFEEAFKYMYSCVEYYDESGRTYYCLAYKDKEFKNLYRTSKVKYTKNGSIIFRIYAESQDGYNIEIEKYDNNKKLISKKQYYLVRLFAKILLGLLDFFTTRVKYA